MRSAHRTAKALPIPSDSIVFCVARACRFSSVVQYFNVFLFKLKRQKMNRRQYITFLGSLILAATCAASAIAIAQEKWPDKPVRLIVPFPPGGGTDMLSRMIGAQLGKENGKAFVVENHPGAGGNIGLDLVAKAAADGYTIGMGQATNLTINPSLY